MSDNETNAAGPAASEPKKPSQADAIKRILEKKKQQGQRQGGQAGFSSNGKQMKTQIHKVQNNQKRRTGV
jgi:hypothetical protein